LQCSQIGLTLERTFKWFPRETVIKAKLGIISPVGGARKRWVGATLGRTS